MISVVKPMSTEHARALAMAYELHCLLAELNDRPENVEGSPIEQAWDLMAEAVALLEPREFNGTEPAPLTRPVRRVRFSP
jgi:hypothetical protein